MALATCSFPVPVSPSINTVLVEWATLLNFADQLHAVEAGHAQIGDDDAVAMLGQVLEGLLAIPRDIDLELQISLQQLLQLSAGHFVVFHDQKPAWHRLGIFGSGRGGSRSA